MELQKKLLLLEKWDREGTIETYCLDADIKLLRRLEKKYLRRLQRIGGIRVYQYLLDKYEKNSYYIRYNGVLYKYLSAYYDIAANLQSVYYKMYECTKDTKAGVDAHLFCTIYSTISNILDISIANTYIDWDALLDTIYNRYVKNRYYMCKSTNRKYVYYTYVLRYYKSIRRIVAAAGVDMRRDVPAIARIDSKYILQLLQPTMRLQYLVNCALYRHYNNYYWALPINNTNTITTTTAKKSKVYAYA